MFVVILRSEDRTFFSKRALVLQVVEHVDRFCKTWYAKVNIFWFEALQGKNLFYLKKCCYVFQRPCRFLNDNLSESFPRKQTGM